MCIRDSIPFLDDICNVLSKKPNKFHIVFFGQIGRNLMHPFFLFTFTHIRRAIRKTADVYKRQGNNYKIHKINGFPEDIPANYSENFNGIKVDIRGLNLYYIFNNRKFSYPAAFSQSTNQHRNAGSFIAGFSISKHNLEFDYTELPDFILETMNPGMKVNNIKYTNANISFGYAYNWVFARCV